MVVPWQSIDSQSDLDSLYESVCWSDSETVEYFVRHVNLPEFPKDISRSGYALPNVYLLVDVCGTPAQWLEMVWIHADHFDAAFVQNPFMNGRVDSLKRVEVFDFTGAVRMRCARVMYRFQPSVEPVTASPFMRLFVVRELIERD